MHFPKKPISAPGAVHVSNVSSSSEDAATLHLPRILCLHGGGTNSRIFRTQCRSLRAQLAPFFRLVFADAPRISGPGPDVTTAYASWGPFRSWLVPGTMVLSRGGPNQLPTSVSKIVADSIDRCVEAAMQEDDDAGATGDWVGVIGFSQGAKIAGGLLLRQQNQNRTNYDVSSASSAESSHRNSLSSRLTDFRFGVLMAGPAPLVSLDVGVVYKPPVPGSPNQALLTIPTVHVHGTNDPGWQMHRDLQHFCCEKQTTVAVEWDGGHRVPIKTKDVAAVVAEILKVADAVGVLQRDYTFA